MWNTVTRSSVSIWILLLQGLILSLHISCIHGAASSCQDIDHSACVSMAGQMPNMCADPNIGLSACPRFCNKCPTICYSCTRTSHDVSDCNPITCTVGQMCLRKTIVQATSVPSVTYHMSCDTREICSRNKRNGPSFDIHCCGTDLCNAPPLPTTSSTSESVLPTNLSLSTSRPISTIPASNSSPTPALTTDTTQTVSTTLHPPITSTTPTRASTFSTRPPYTPYHLTTIPWIYFPTVSLPYTLTTIPQHNNQHTDGHLAPANHNLLYSINASCRSDVYVLVDESCSNYTFNHIVKHTLHDIINQLDTRRVNVSLATYNTSIYPYHNLNRYTQKSDLQLDVDKLAIYGNGHSDNNVVVDNLLSNKTADVVILFSNNRQFLGQSNSRHVATDITQLHSMYRSIIVIGLDNADIGDIAEMATNAFNIFSLPPYTHEYLVEWILHEICPDLVI